MSGKMKTALGIVLAAVVIGGLYYWYVSTRPAAAPVATTGDTANNGAPAGPTLPSGNDTSDAALAQDSASVDADMTAMTSDTAAIDAGMNDTAVAQ